MLFQLDFSSLKSTTENQRKSNVGKLQENSMVWLVLQGKVRVLTLLGSCTILRQRTPKVLKPLLYILLVSVIWILNAQSTCKCSREATIFNHSRYRHAILHDYRQVFSDSKIDGLPTRPESGERSCMSGLGRWIGMMFYTF